MPHPTPEPRAVFALETRHVGRAVRIYETLASTNDLAAGLAADPANAGVVVVADHQTAGRGQHGRPWQSRPGASLLLSAVVFPPPELRRPVVLTAWAGVAVARAVEELAGVRADLKWPNDVLIGGRKVCGILIEQGRGTVVGIGLNLNQTGDEFAAAGLPAATSLGLAGGRPCDPGAALRTVVRQLDAEYGRLLAGEVVPLEAEWRERMGLVGRPVSAEMADGTTARGRLNVLRFDGLTLEAADGSLRQVRPDGVRHFY